jgi:hypothetical protein
MFFMGGGHHHHSSSSKSNSKSNNNNGGIVILIGIALATLVVFLLSKFIQRKSNADIASGIDVVLADENENIVYVDISEEAEIMLRHEVTQNGLTEGYLRNGGGAYVVGTVYTDGDQIHVGPGDKDHPLIVSSFTEEELVAKFEKSKTTALIVSLCIFAAISGIPTLLFGLLVAWS